MILLMHCVTFMKRDIFIATLKRIVFLCPIRNLGIWMNLARSNQLRIHHEQKSMQRLTITLFQRFWRESHQVLQVMYIRLELLLRPLGKPLKITLCLNLENKRLIWNWEPKYVFHFYIFRFVSFPFVIFLFVIFRFVTFRFLIFRFFIFRFLIIRFLIFRFYIFRFLGF
jgi:hypothetical protein